MNSKSPKDRVIKAAWTLSEGTKDAIIANVTTASRSGQLDIKPDQLPRLLMIIGASSDEGYHRGSRVFAKAVDEALHDATSTAPTATATKKKSV